MRCVGTRYTLLLSAAYAFLSEVQHCGYLRCILRRRYASSFIFLPLLLFYFLTSFSLGTPPNSYSKKSHKLHDCTSRHLSTKASTVHILGPYLGLHRPDRILRPPDALLSRCLEGCFPSAKTSVTSTATEQVKKASAEVLTQLCTYKLTLPAHLTIA